MLVGGNVVGLVAALDELGGGTLALAQTRPKVHLLAFKDFTFLQHFLKPDRKGDRDYRDGAGFYCFCFYVTF